MAIIQKTTYHEDITPRRAITQEDIDFLHNLQTEMNTQDNVGQASPRFWVIKDYIKTWSDEGDEPVIFNLEDSYEDDMENLKDVADHINNSFLSNEYRVITTHYGEPCTDLNKINLLLIYEFSGTDDEFLEAQNELDLYPDTEIETMEDAYEWLIDNASSNYQLRYWSLEGRIAPDTMFLTLKDAEEHLIKNHYHYHKNAHAFAMTAWRSPTVEKLYEILEHADFTALIPQPAY